jgi:elongation factor Ts
MEVSTSLIKELKEKTGAGIVDCKQTLLETNGDMDKAVDILRKKGMGKADKKAGRAANQGTVAYKLEGKKGVVVKINCETDFVAKTDSFKQFVMDVTDLVFKKGKPFTAELPEDLETLRRNAVAMVGENVLISDWKFIEGKGELYPYTHCDKFAVKVAVIADYNVDKQDDDAKQLMKNVSMQITAMNPAAVDADSLSAATLDELKKKFMEEAKETGKPEKILENIVKGKMEKFYNESLLMEQVYILDEEKKVKAVIDDYSKSKGINLKVNGFVRVAL